MINKDKRADLRPKKLKQGLYLCSSLYHGNHLREQV